MQIKYVYGTRGINRVIGSIGHHHKAFPEEGNVCVHCGKPIPNEKTYCFDCSFDMFAEHVADLEEELGRELSDTERDGVWDDFEECL